MFINGVVDKRQHVGLVRAKLLGHSPAKPSKVKVKRAKFRL